MTAPFGIAIYAPLAEFNSVEEVAPNVFTLRPPTPHPLFETYLVRATPKLGVVWIKGIGPDTASDSFGSAVRSAVDRIRDQLALRYGSSEKQDFLMQGSIWSEPQYWMNAVLAQERFYSYLWKSQTKATLPEDLSTVYASALLRDASTFAIIVEYASPKINLADAEEDERMSGLL